MEWTTQIKEKTHKLRLPEKILNDVPFQVSIGDKTKTLRWQKATRTMFILEKAENGLVVERPLLIRTSNIARPQGEAKSQVSLEFSAHRTASFEATVGRYVYGQENRDKAAQSKGAVIRSPITGKVLKVYFQDGDTVNQGDVIAIVEAMKMENKIIAPTSGTLHGLNLEEGGSITTGTQITAIKGEG